MNIKYLFNIPFVLAQQNQAIELYGPPLPAPMYGSGYPQSFIQKSFFWLSQNMPLWVIILLPLMLIILVLLGIYILLKKTISKNDSKIS